MKKIKFLYIVILALVLLNVFTLGFFFMKGPKGDKKQHNPKEIIIKKLHFNDRQIAEYEKLIPVHFEKIKGLDENIKKAKIDLYSQLAKPKNESITDSLYHVIANAQLEIEKTHYEHFLDIKNICEPNQFKDFDNLSKELAKMFAIDKKPNR